MFAFAFAFAEVAPSLPAIKRATACKSPMTVGVGDLPALERPPLRFAASALKKSEISLVGLAKLLAKSKGKKKPPEVAAQLRARVE